MVGDRTTSDEALRCVGQAVAQTYNVIAVNELANGYRFKPFLCTYVLYVCIAGVLSCDDVITIRVKCAIIPRPFPVS